MSKPVPVMPNIAECDKLTFGELCSKILQFNRNHNVTYGGNVDAHIKARIVFNPTASEWRKFYEVTDENGVTKKVPITYTPAGCTYEIGNHDKYWDAMCGGSSIYGFSLDPNELDSHGIKLSDYLHDWKIDYCYIVSVKEPGKDPIVYVQNS